MQRGLALQDSNIGVIVDIPSNTLEQFFKQLPDKHELLYADPQGSIECA